MHKTGAEQKDELPEDRQNKTGAEQKDELPEDRQKEKNGT